MNGPVAESTYRHVIENGISAVEKFTDPAALAYAYMVDEWLPFALSVRSAWLEADKVAREGTTTRRAM